MKRPKFFTFGMIWLTAAAATFLQYVQNEDPAALIRCGVFLLFGVLYMYMNSNNKKKK